MSTTNFIPSNASIGNERTPLADETLEPFIDRVRRDATNKRTGVEDIHAADHSRRLPIVDQALRVKSQLCPIIQLSQRNTKLCDAILGSDGEDGSQNLLMSEEVVALENLVCKLLSDQTQEESDSHASFVPVVSASALLLEGCLVKNCEKLDLITSGFHDLGALESTEGTKAVTKQSVRTGRLNLLDGGVVCGDHFFEGREERLAIKTTSADGIDWSVGEVTRKVHEDENLAGAGVEQKQRSLVAIWLQDHDGAVGLRLHVIDGDSQASDDRVGEEHRDWHLGDVEAFLEVES